MAEPGKTTAIIGSTGCGKSTLVNLIPRLYDATEGSITLDGENIKNISMKELRDELGYVPQKGILFSGTIESNIKFGAPEASMDIVKEAAEIAQATEFIETKSAKYESPIAQGGTMITVLSVTLEASAFLSAASVFKSSAEKLSSNINILGFLQ